MDTIQEYNRARVMLSDTWVIACGGTEKPTKTRSGRTYVYVYNFRIDKHGWLDVETDIVQMDNPYV